MSQTEKAGQPESPLPPGEGAPEKPRGQPQLLRGMKDVLPADQPYWDAVRRVVEDIARSAWFERIETPILEQASLFQRTVGPDTDIVEKEMYTFVDASGDKLALRPENTASIARAYLEHGMVSWPQPVRLYYFAPFFRHDRPQAGRYRQFWQFGFEVLGDAHPVIDAFVIYLTHAVYQSFSLSTEVQINSIGDAACRPAYVRELVEYFRPRKNSLCEACKRRLQKTPLRILDCKETDCRTLSNEAPQIVDHLCEPCRDHFVHVLEYLGELEIRYDVNPRIVRGLDYYTRTVFQVVEQGTSEAAAQAELGGGGRYDGLVELLGGRSVPGCGFAGGAERLILKLKEHQFTPPPIEKPEVFLGQLGEAARRKCLRLYDVLRSVQISVAEAFSKDGLKAQLEVANRLGTKYALIIGQKELMDDTILIRDMENGIQEVVDFKKVVPEIKKRLAKVNSTVGVSQSHPAPVTQEQATQEQS